VSKPVFERLRRGLEDVRSWMKGDDSPLHACYCVGPRPGQKFCPCQMRHAASVEQEICADLDPYLTGVVREINEQNSAARVVPLRKAG